MKRLLSTLLLLATPAVLLAQAAVHGTVVDQQTGTPIVGASVVVTGTTTGTLTNDAGVFSLTTDRTSGSITVASPGYTEQTVAIPGTGEAIYVRLVPSTVELPGVQVLGHRPMPSEAVLTEHDLERANGLSLESSINTVPGVFMQSRAPWGGARITIRGYYPSTGGNSPNSNGLGYKVFLNNIPVTDATGTTVLDDVDYSTLGSVEVIKGPASSRYGSYIGGTVKLATARPAPSETSIGQQVVSGNDGLLRTNTTFQTASANSDLALNYGHQSYDSFRPHSGSTKEFLRASGDVNIGTNQTLSTYFSYNRSFEELAGEIDTTAFYDREPLSNAAYLANDSHIAVTSFFAGATDSYRINDRFTNRTTLYGNGRTSSQPFAHGFTDATQFSFGARSAFSYAGRLGTVGVTGTLGGSIERSNITTNGVFIIPAPPFPQRPSAKENHATNGSLFTEWSFALPSQVTVAVGASLNKNRFAIRDMLEGGQLTDTTTLKTKSFDAVVTPRLSVTKGFGPNASVYASVSSGYTPPLLNDAIANDGSVNLALDPERAVQYEVGVQGSLLNDRLSGQVALFDLENTDKLVTQTVNSVRSTTNAGKQRNRGAEVSLSYLAIDDGTKPLSLLRPWVSYTYTDATYLDFRSDANNDAGTVDFSGNAVPRVPRNMVSVGVDLQTNQGVYVNGTYQYTDRVPVTFDNAAFVKSYDLLGAKVGVKRQVTSHWVLDVAAGGDNLLGSTYYNFLFIGPNYAGLATSADGGHGDGYIIPAPYKATYYGNVGLRYIF